MTCVIAIVTDNGSVVLAADSGGFQDAVKEIRIEPKIFQKHGALFGYAGCFRTGQILEYVLDQDIWDLTNSVDAYEEPISYLVTTFVPKLIKHLKKNGALTNNSGSKTMDAEFLLAYGGRAFKVESNFNVSELESVGAIGSAAHCALGYLAGLRASGRYMTAYDAALKCLGDIKRECTHIAEPFYALEL